MHNKNFIPFPILTTKRLTLRQLSESDAEQILSLRSDAVINKYLGRQPAKTLDDALNFIRKTNENIKKSPLKYWAITLNGSEKLTGTICLFDYSEELEKCEIGYELLTDYQGQGIMSEATKKIIDYAFLTLRLKTIDACTHKDNQSSTKLLQKLNFEKTGIVDETNPDMILFRLAN